MLEELKTVSYCLPLTQIRCATVTNNPIASAFANPKSLLPLSFEIEANTVTTSNMVNIISMKKPCVIDNLLLSERLPNLPELSSGNNRYVMATPHIAEKYKEIKNLNIIEDIFAMMWKNLPVACFPLNGIFQTK